MLFHLSEQQRSLVRFALCGDLKGGGGMRTNNNQNLTKLSPQL